MRRSIIIILSLTLIIFGANISNLNAKEKAKGKAFQCQILVADSGGDFTNIQEAIDSLDPDPEIPCTILVAAGTYTESIQINKSHIHLKGSGYERTFLKPVSNNPVITLDGVNDVEISGLTIRDAYTEGIKSLNSSLTINRNQFVENEVAVYLAGSIGTIEKNVFDQNEGRNFGSISIRSSKALVSNNTFIGGEAVTTDFESGYGNITIATITENNFTDVYPAIDNKASRPGCLTRITGNLITGSRLDIGIRSEGPAVISENMIEKCSLFAILNFADHAVISNNLLRENGVNGGSAISTSGASTITGNTILSNSGHGVKIVDGVATVNGNTFKNNLGFGVSSAGSAIIMGNTFVDNGLGCIEYGTGTVVAANLCHNTLSLYGTITSTETLTIQANKDFNITTDRDINLVAEDVNISANLDLNVAAEEMSVQTNKDIFIKANKNIYTNALNTSIKSSNNTNIDSGKDTTIKTVGTTEIKSGGPVIIKGSTVPWMP